MKRAAQRYALAVGIALVLFTGAIRFLKSSPPAPPGTSGGVAGSEPVPTPTPAPPGEGRPALVFFADPAGGGLVARRTEVTPHADASLQAQAILEAMLAGPSALAPPSEGETVEPSLPAVPEGVGVRAVFFDGKGAAVVDLASLAERLPGGSDAEVLALWSVVNTLAFNFPADARRVRVLLDGRESRSLSHVSLAAPLAPRRDFVVGEIPSLAVPLASGQGVVSAPGATDDGDDEDDGPSPFDDLAP